MQIAIEGPVDPATGWLMDFGEMHRVWAPLHEALDHRYLNELPIFRNQNPSSENLAAYIFSEVSRRIRRPA